MTDLALSTARPAKVKADAVVIGVLPPEGQAAKRAGDVVVAPGGEAVADAMGRGFAATLRALGVDGSAGSVTRIPTAGNLKAPTLVVVGLGASAGEWAGIHDLERLRRAAGAAARGLAGVEHAAVALRADDAASVRAVAEGVLLGAYDYRTYKTADGTKPLGAATIMTTRTRDKAVAAALDAARHVAMSVNLARDWINCPPNDMTPAAFADASVALAKEAGLKAEVLDDKALARQGYGGIIAVGQGSTNPPRLVRLAYSPRGAVARFAFVGKGITFDSGGLSIKPADGMMTMKCDMSGAAAVVTAAAAIARLRLPVEVVAYAALAENLPSATAQRPSDVYRAYGGKTVEVLNTDAEGRLVLADAIVRAAEDSPEAVIDVATLTGAMVVALGPRVFGVMANDDDLRAALVDAAGRGGEQAWPLPLPPAMREKLDSKVADIANIGDRWGGGLQAGLFLQEFVPDGQKWAHLDIAGPAFNEGSAHGYTPKGGTGEAVRTLVRFAEAAAAG